MRHLPDVVGLLRHREGHRQVRLHLGADALLSRCRGRTAELDHRRRVAVAEEYKGVAKFFTFLSDTDRQAKLHQESGYLPITKAAYEKTKASGFYQTTPIPETPLKELTNKEPTENSRGLRFGNMVQMREIWAEEIEAALGGQKTAKDALDAAVARGNAMLRTFEKTAK
jgi:sn-glycerol 3-phosphate transport system substrate-binding protein